MILKSTLLITGFLLLFTDDFELGVIGFVLIVLCMGLLLWQDFRWPIHK